MQHHYPKVKKALCRAIEHEVRRPGEFLDYLTYLHIEAMEYSYKKSLVLKKIEARKHGA